MNETGMNMDRYADDSREELIETMGILLESAQEIEDRCQRMVAIYKELIARRDALTASGANDQKTKDMIATYKRRSDALGRELRQVAAKRESLMNDLRGLDSYLTATSPNIAEA